MLHLSKKYVMKNILFEKIENVAKITLNRPKSYNSVTRDMALEIQTVLDDCAKDNNIRAIYLTGAGKAFCAGQDLNEITDKSNGLELSKIVAEHYNPIVLRLRNIEKPIIAAVNGVAAGAGANIALACDVVVANQHASFMQAFSKIGLIPDSGGTFTLPRLIGWQKASALMMLAEKIPAQEAERLGMIYKYFEEEVFEDESWKLAVKLSRMPTQGLGYTKRALNLSLTNSFAEQLDIEQQLQVAASKTHDYNEGVAAFLEKRKPDFIGK